MYDVLVIGSGPGGAAAAYGLARRGQHVLMLDKQAFPRSKTCGDGLTPRAQAQLAAMEIDPLTLPESHRTTHVAVVGPDGAQVRMPLPALAPWPGSIVMVPRLVLDAAIRERAIAAGVETRQVRVAAVRPDADGVSVSGDAAGAPFTARARMAILATGAHTSLLQQTRLRRRPSPVALAARAYVDHLDQLESDTVQFHFDCVPLPGYGWVFPLSASRANVGLGAFPCGWPWARRQHPVPPKRAFAAFIHSPRLRAMFARATIAPMYGFPIRMDFPTAATAGPRLLCVGEAAGLVNPMTGDGIDFALESGLLAADLIATAFADAARMAHVHRTYADALRQRFAGFFRLCAMLGQVMQYPALLNRLVHNAARHPGRMSTLMEMVLGPLPPGRYFARHVRGG
jgi:geranylgeranyl reductase family protein